MSDPTKILGIFQRIFEELQEFDNNLADGTNDNGDDDE